MGENELIFNLSETVTEVDMESFRRPLRNPCPGKGRICDPGIGGDELSNGTMSSDLLDTTDTSFIVTDDSSLGF